MNYKISYFAQMRNFKSNVLPVSTAAWDQEWFRGIDRIDELLIPLEAIEKLEKQRVMCQKDCKQTIPCAFMKEYKKYLDTLDFNNIIELLNSKVKSDKIDTIVLLVYEKPTTKCAERPVLQEWFAEHGIELAEWEKPNHKVSLI